MPRTLVTFRSRKASVFRIDAPHIDLRSELSSKESDAGWRQRHWRAMFANWSACDATWPYRAHVLRELRRHARVLDTRSLWSREHHEDGDPRILVLIARIRRKDAARGPAKDHQLIQALPAPPCQRRDHLPVVEPAAFRYLWRCRKCLRRSLIGRRGCGRRTQILHEGLDERLLLVAPAVGGVMAG